MHRPSWGVWAGRDSQLVVTPKVMLYFHRTGKAITAAFWQRLGVPEGTYRLHGFVAASNNGTWAGTLMGVQEQHPTAIGNADPGFSLPHDALQVSTSGGGLKIDPPTFGVADLILVEPVVPTEQLPGTRASAATIGDCILEWNQGTTYYTDTQHPDSIHCDVNTRHNWHIFETWKQDNGLSVYCRCARVAACNSGMVFAQNVRIIVPAGGSRAQSYMADDNCRMLRRHLSINPTRFRSDACTFLGPLGLEWTEIHWPLKEFGPDLITLHGCDGKDYLYKRPTGQGDHRVESFEN